MKSHGSRSSAGLWQRLAARAAGRAHPIVGFLAALLLAGCSATLPDRNAVPEALVGVAQVEGMDDIRTWGDEAQSSSRRFILTEGPALREKYRERARRGEKLSSNLLALSGGADDGAFGAGLLVGWGERGQRPQFDLVTGVSAGALIAPFAFIGSDYDRQLSEIFTRYDSGQIYEANILSGILGGPGFAKNDPLKRLIEKYVDEALMRRLAEERSKGRMLLIGTTNIDIQRPVYWDAGRIAQTGGQRSVELLRSVLLASAAIPGVFPPVRIKVKVNGKEFEELHVNGGATREVFYSPADFSFRDLDKSIGRRVDRKLYVIRNGKIGPEWEATQETALALGARSLLTILKNQTIGDLIRMHSKAKADGIDYNLAVIPDTFKAPHPAPFDQKYMQALYAEGLKLGREGYAWHKLPPGLLQEASR